MNLGHPFFPALCFMKAGLRAVERVRIQTSDTGCEVSSVAGSLDIQGQTFFMDIEVKLFATLRDYLPKGSDRFSCKLKVEGRVRVQDIISKLKIPEEIPKIILVNGIHGKPDQILKGGDVVSIFPPVAGG